MQDIKWIKLTEDNVPEVEVFCTYENKYFYYSEIFFSKNGYFLLRGPYFGSDITHEKVTHFIDPKSIPYED